MSAIEWTDRTWNPTTGCDKVSPGCEHCYALTMAARLKAMGQPRYQHDGDPRTSGPGFGLAVHDDVLNTPLRWRTPQRVFVNSMSDLLHPRVPEEFLARVFAVMAATPRHTYQILTKRHARLRSLLSSEAFAVEVCGQVENLGGYHHGLPLPNVHIGVSPMQLDWATSLISQCTAAGVPVFIKQLGSVWARQNGADPKGGDWAHWPAELRVRQFPTAPGAA